jgi:dTDP-glucose pyrophosphorylase
MNIIITMAGNSSRFKAAGYKIEKYKIITKNQTLFYRSISSLKQYIEQDCKFIFIVKKTDGSKDFIQNEINILNIKNYKIIEISSSTRGQAETAIMAEKYLNPKEPVAIFNIDTQINKDYLQYFNNNDIDGFIPCFIAYDKKWSFVKIDHKGYASLVKEKDPISNYATIGFYWFKSFELYKNIYTKYYSNEYEEIELYIAPLYNEIIKNNGKITISIIPNEALIALGTPEDLNNFIKNNVK